MILYRGSAIKDVKPQLHYWYTGILINSTNGGNPFTIDNNPLLSLAERHVYPESDDTHYHDVSDFLSFTEDKKIAEYYMSNKKRLAQASINMSPTHVIFEWEIQDKVQIRPGMYICEYTIDYTNAEKILQTYINLSTGVGIADCLAIAGEKNQFSGHTSKVLLLNLVEISRHFHNIFSAVTMKRISKDKEWLVLPADQNKYDPILNRETLIRPNFGFSIIFYR